MRNPMPRTPANDTGAWQVVTERGIPLYGMDRFLALTII